MNAARRHHAAKFVPLTAEDKAIFHRASARQEREYRKADGIDAEIALLRLTRGGIVANVKRGQS